MEIAKFNVGFYAIKSRGKLTTNYKTLAQILEENGYNAISFAEFPISRENLAPLDILVIPCPDNNKISKNEIQAIKAWVTQDGGGLLMLSHAGGDKGRRTNLTELSEKFGMIFENNQVFDKHNNLGVENLPVIEQFTVPHPISEGLTKIVFRAGCSLSISGMNVSPVISSGPKADPFESPLLLASEDGEGRAVALGSYEMFRDKISGGIRENDHGNLAINIFNWLKTTRREQIKAGMAPPISSYNPQGQIQADDSISSDHSSMGTNTAFSSQANLNYGIQPRTFESSVKIIANEDLITAFENTLKEFYSFKQRMLQDFEIFENNLALLMKAVLASEEDIINLKNNQAQETQTTQEDDLNFDLENEDETTEYQEESDTEITPESFQFDFTDLNKQDNSNKENSSQPTQELPKNSTNHPISKVKEEKKPKSKEELLEEKDNLENKLNSIRNLSEFVEKKYTSGKLNKVRYEKQIKKLETDSKNSEERLKEIQDLLDQM